MTWGAIQHQFGTRQALLLAVLEDRWQRLTDHIESTAVSGTTLEERLACVMAALESHYGDPEHLVLSQIMLDLVQSPATSATTKRAIVAHGRELTRVWRPLFAKALGEAAADETTVRYAFLDHPRLSQRQHHGGRPRPAASRRDRPHPAATRRRLCHPRTGRRGRTRDRRSRMNGMEAARRGPGRQAPSAT